MLKKNWLALWMVLALLFSMVACIAMPAVAAEEEIEISTAEQLLALANGDLAGRYIQTADIDLSGLNYTPIGSPTLPFTGEYDGNGYTISGLTLDSDRAFQGLFGVNCGEIRNLTLAENCSVKGSSYVGAIAGFNQGKIENCISRAKVAFKKATESTTAATYGIMSQNLCQWGDNDLTAFDDYQDSVSHSRRPSMMKRIENSDPDVVLFQEVSFNNYKYNGKTITAWDTYLRNTMTDYTIVGTYRSNSDKEGVTIAFKNDTFELIDEGMFWLSENPDAPRSQQKKAWDAACVRAAQWVVLKDKTTGQLLITCSTHTDHVGVVARAKGTLLIAERMTALMEKYPTALLAVGGDFNNAPTSEGYLNMEAGINGLLDDSRYVAENRINNIGTHGSIDNLDYVGGEMNTIDYIYINSATTEASTFYVMNDNYYDLRPSDHEGVFASIKVRENNFIGGICGANGGEISNIVAEGEVNSGAAFGSGAVIANALLRGKLQAIYAKDISTEDMVGTAVAFKELPETPNQYMVDKLNQSSGIFELKNGKYAILQGCAQNEIAEVIYRGVSKYCFVGSTFNFEVADGETVYLNGEPYEGNSIIVPAEGAIISVITPIQMVTEAVVGGDFSVCNIEDFLYLYENLSLFQSRNIAIHLFCDIDFSDARLASFAGFIDPGFSFEGYGHTFSNYGSKETPKKNAFFCVNQGDYGMKFVRNLKVVDCYVNGAAILCRFYHGNAGLEGLSATLELKGISLNRCFLKAGGQACSILLSRYGAAGINYTVDISDIRITNCELDSGAEHIGLVVGKIRSSNSSVGTFNISDCYLYGNTIKNAIVGVGFVGGSAENTVNVNFNNIGVFNNTALCKDGAQMSYLFSDSSFSGQSSIENLMFAGNTTDADETYMSAAFSTEAKANIGSFWIDKELTALMEGKTESYTVSDSKLFKSGEIGWSLNNRLESPAFWWMMDKEGNYKPASEDQRLCKITLHMNEEKTFYCNAGDQFELPEIGEGIYTVEQGESTVEDGKLLVKSDTVVYAKIPVSAVKSAVSGGHYTVSSLEEWMMLYENIDYFRNRNVTIHLLCDIDLSDEAAAEFTCFENPTFSLDGYGHTVSHWGSKEAPRAERALFYISEGAGGMNFIKNINFEDCHVSTGGCAAIVYSCYHSNSGYEGLSADFLLENIAIKGCSVQVSGECAALLLSRYGVAGKEFTVNIRGCKVEDSSLASGGTAHKGLLIGKPRQTDKAGTFNIEGCYLAGNTITDASNHVGFIFGSAEGGNTRINIRNVGVINNKQTASLTGAYAGASGGDGPISLKNVLFEGNTIHAPNKYMVSIAYNTAKGIFENVYGDMTDLTAAVEGDAATTFTPNAEQVASGEAAWLLNGLMEEPLFYWGQKDGVFIPVDEAHRLAKITFQVGEGKVFKKFYVPAGSVIALEMERDPEATFALVGGEALEGDSYTVPLGTTEVAIQVFSEKEEILLGNSVTAVTAPVTEGFYVIEDIDDWMYVFDHIDFFNSEEVTLILSDDIDLSDSKAATFTGFKDAAFSLDGAGHTIKNWTSLAEGTTSGNALFINYTGRKVSDLKFENCKIGGGYARSLLIGQYTATHSLEISNIHVKNCIVDATTTGNQMGILLARTVNNAQSGATVTIKNCSVVNTSLKNSGGARINNSGIIVGSAYRKFKFEISDILINNCSVETNTGAGGIAIGAVEDSGTSLTMERVGIFKASIKAIDTNEIPGVFIGEALNSTNISLKNCMAAEVSADNREKVAAVCHSGTSLTFSVRNCFTDFEPLEVISTNGADGITSGTPTTISGAEKLTNAAFKNGEAAWKMNMKSDKAYWTVGADGAYPTLFAKEGMAAPLRVSFGGDAAYTDGAGKLSAEEFAQLPLEEGHWLLGEDLVAENTLYTADSILVQAAHQFGTMMPDGEAQHKQLCTGCGIEKMEDCIFDQEVTDGAGIEPIHYRSCRCGNKAEEACSLKHQPIGGGLHQSICEECSYKDEAELCDYAEFTHVEGSKTHVGKCEICEGLSDPIPCELTLQVEKEPQLGVDGCAYWICTENCGYHEQVALPALGDCDGNGEITISDAVMILRVLSGTLDADLLEDGADVYQEDGYTENGGISTADALMILKYVLEQV